MAESKKSEVRHFRCAEFAQLTIMDGDNVAARFEAYLERFAGENVRAGYLETDDPKVIKRCEDDLNVESISEDDYKKATGPKSFKLPVSV